VSGPLGPYTILAELGHGGMGVVYTAQDPRLDRQVAIKVLPPDLTRDDTAKQRFLQEAKGASSRQSEGPKGLWHTARPVSGYDRPGQWDNQPESRVRPRR
jgi:serine/threonine protein kinase